MFVAHVILKGKKRIATVTGSVAPRGSTVRVECRQNEPAAEKSFKAAAKAGGKPKALKIGDSEPLEALYHQTAKAGGYGYDKFTAALSGMWIDGHKMTNHCGASWPKPKGKDLFPRTFKAPRGYRLANYTERDGKTGYMDCYRLDGLNYLADIGYTVITVSE